MAMRARDEHDLPPNVLAALRAQGALDAPPAEPVELDVQRVTPPPADPPRASSGWASAWRFAAWAAALYVGLALVIAFGPAIVGAR